MATRATDKDYQAALEGLDYPVSRDAVIRTAADHGGIDSEVNATLQLLPDRTYDSAADLFDAIHAIRLEAAAVPDSPPEAS